jgi:hypothetical protein
MQLDFR